MLSPSLSWQALFVGGERELSWEFIFLFLVSLVLESIGPMFNLCLHQAIKTRKLKFIPYLQGLHPPANQSLHLKVVSTFYMWEQLKINVQWQLFWPISCAFTVESNVIGRSITIMWEKKLQRWENFVLVSKTNGLVVVYVDVVMRQEHWSPLILQYCISS